MKISSKAVAVILVVLGITFAVTTCYGWDWFGIKKTEVVQPSQPKPNIQRTKIPSLKETGINVSKPIVHRDPLSTAVTACADAYRTIKDTVAVLTIEPTCSQRMTSGEAGLFTTNCYTVSYWDPSDPAYPLNESVYGSGGVSASNWDLCWELTRPSGWPRNCFKADETWNIMRPLATTTLADAINEGYTFEMLTDPSSPINQETSMLNGALLVRPRLPVIELLPRSSGVLGATPYTQLMVFRIFFGSQCTNAIKSAFLDYGKTIICVDSDMQYFENGCR